MNQRKLAILEALSNLEVLSRDQIMVMHDTKSVRNTNFIMNDLKPYVNSVRVDGNVYYLNKKGVALVGAKKQFKFNDQVIHKLMRNDSYIYFNPTQWVAEQEIAVGKIVVQPDAYFYSGSSYKFLEVDNTQKWQVNVKKMESYKKLKDTGAFQQKNGKFPTLIWVIKFDSRKDKLKELAKKMGVFCEIYHHDEIKL